MNKWLGVGRTTKEVEVRYAGDTAVARTSIAIDRKTKEKATDFINIVAFGKTALALEKVQKGQRVGIEGHIQTGSYLKQDGTKAYTTDVVVDSVEYLEKKEEKTDPLPELDEFFSAGDEGIPFR